MKDRFLIELAAFARDSQLRKKLGSGAPKITPLQRTWTRYMLMNWGEKMRGDESPECRGAGNIIGRMMWSEKWNDDQGRRIQLIFSNLGRQGYSGDDLIRKVKEIFLPSNSGSSIISLAKEQDDAEFVEKCMGKAFAVKNPAKAVLIKRYCERKCSQEIAEDMTEMTGINLEVARIRVRWAETLAEMEIYYFMCREMENENPQIAV